MHFLGLVLGVCWCQGMLYFRPSSLLIISSPHVRMVTSSDNRFLSGARSGVYGTYPRGHAGCIILSDDFHSVVGCQPNGKVGEMNYLWIQVLNFGAGDQASILI
jgi:hypothetical protein